MFSPLELLLPLLTALTSPAIDATTISSETVRVASHERDCLAAFDPQQGGRRGHGGGSGRGGGGGRGDGGGGGAPVPEPGSTTMMMLAAGGLAFLARRKRNGQA